MFRARRGCCDMSGRRKLPRHSLPSTEVAPVSPPRAATTAHERLVSKQSSAHRGTYFGTYKAAGPVRRAPRESKPATLRKREEGWKDIVEEVDPTPRAGPSSAPASAQQVQRRSVWQMVVPGEAGSAEEVGNSTPTAEAGGRAMRYSQSAASLHDAMAAAREAEARRAAVDRERSAERSRGHGRHGGGGGGYPSSRSREASPYVETSYRQPAHPPRPRHADSGEAGRDRGAYDGRQRWGGSGSRAQPAAERSAPRPPRTPPPPPSPPTPPPPPAEHSLAGTTPREVELRSRLKTLRDQLATLASTEGGAPPQGGIVATRREVLAFELGYAAGSQGLDPMRLGAMLSGYGVSLADGTRPVLPEPVQPGSAAPAMSTPGYASPWHAPPTYAGPHHPRPGAPYGGTPFMPSGYRWDGPPSGYGDPHYAGYGAVPPSAYNQYSAPSPSGPGGPGGSTPARGPQPPHARGVSSGVQGSGTAAPQQGANAGRWVWVGDSSDAGGHNEHTAPSTGAQAPNSARDGPAQAPPAQEAPASEAGSATLPAPPSEPEPPLPEEQPQEAPAPTRSSAPVPQQAPVHAVDGDAILAMQSLVGGAAGDGGAHQQERRAAPTGAGGDTQGATEAKASDDAPSSSAPGSEPQSGAASWPANVVGYGAEPSVPSSNGGAAARSQGNGAGGGSSGIGRPPGLAPRGDARAGDMREGGVRNGDDSDGGDVPEPPAAAVDDLDDVPPPPPLAEHAAEDAARAAAAARANDASRRGGSTVHTTADGVPVKVRGPGDPEPPAGVPPTASVDAPRDATGTPARAATPAATPATTSTATPSATPAAARARKRDYVGPLTRSQQRIIADVAELKEIKFRDVKLWVEDDRKPAGGSWQNSYVSMKMDQKANFPIVKVKIPRVLRGAEVAGDFWMGENLFVLLVEDEDNGVQIVDATEGEEIQVLNLVVQDRALFVGCTQAMSREVGIMTVEEFEALEVMGRRAAAGHGARG